MARRRDPRGEAKSTLGPGWRPQVLEPSPPAILDEPYMADDPLDEPPGQGIVVSPFHVTPNPRMVTWRELIQHHPDLVHFARERWLAAWKRLEPLPPDFAQTRLGLHLVAAYLLAPVRQKATRKIGLRATLDGFGTPFFLDGEGRQCQLRVEGLRLVLQRGDEVQQAPITSLDATAAALGFEPDFDWATDYDIPEPGNPSMPLELDPIAARSLSDWFGFATSVLEEFRSDPVSHEISRPQLWPEHFDPAVEIGTDRRRLSAGFSPGDEDGDHPEPYVYLSAWYHEDLEPDSFWNSESFPGALLSYGHILEVGDQRGTVLEFLRTGRELFFAGNPQKEPEPLKRASAT